MKSDEIIKQLEIKLGRIPTTQEINVELRRILDEIIKQNSQ